MAMSASRITARTESGLNGTRKLMSASMIIIARIAGFDALIIFILLSLF